MSAPDGSVDLGAQVDLLASGRRGLPPHVRFSRKFGDLETMGPDGIWRRTTGRREHVLRWRAAQFVRMELEGTWKNGRFVALKEGYGT